MSPVKARLYLSTSLYRAPTIFLFAARLNLQKNWPTLMFLIFVFLLITQSFAYIVTFPFFFCLENWFLLWLIICHFFAIFFPSLYSSGALHLSKAHSSLFITFPFIYHLTFTEMAMEINFLYPSFSPELIMRSAMPLPYPVFHQILLFQKNSTFTKRLEKVLQFWHCNPILIQLITLPAAMQFADMGKGTEI